MRAAASADPETRQRAFDALVAAYWKPVYKYLRLKWRAAGEDAEDLTQGFFARAIEKGFFDRFDPARARFRTYLRACLDGFVANERKSAGRLKRGGGRRARQPGLRGRGGRAGPPGPIRQRRHGRVLPSRMGAQPVRPRGGGAAPPLRGGGEGRPLRALRALRPRRARRGARPSYADLAREMAIPETQVTNHLAWARREFRRLVLEALAEATGSEEEFRAEARRLLGIDPS